jgi:hypothetical protein
MNENEWLGSNVDELFFLFRFNGIVELVLVLVVPLNAIASYFSL